MSDEARELCILLQEALSLTTAEPGSGAAIGDHLIEIIANYSFDRAEEDHSDAFAPCDTRTYVESELAVRFELSNMDLNLNVDAIVAWSELFDARWNSIEYALALQIIITLTNLSLLNKSKIGSIKGIKKNLFHRTINAENAIPMVQDMLADIFSLVLTADCTPDDLLELYSHSSKYPISRTVESLTAQLSDPLSQAFLQLENCYQILKIPQSDDTRHTFQLFVEFNTVTSNRFMTIGRDLYLEIDDGKFCVSNDEFVIALFEDFEFEAGILYSITVILDGNDISLHVNGSLIDKLSLLEGTVKMDGNLELGSMISSFKLYRITIYRGMLSENSISVICAIGKSFREASFDTTDLSTVRRAFEDTVLQNSNSSVDLNNYCVDRILDAKKEINSKNVCIDIDPTFLHLPSHQTDSLLSPGDAFGYADTGKCFHYKPAYLLPIFTSINCFRFILCSLENTGNWDDLFKLLSHLLSLLRNNQLRAWFEKEYGFPFLSHILLTKVQIKMKSAFPIQFYNLFQEFCGWNFSNITKSAIEDEAAYQALILNTDLWHFVPTEVSAGRDGIEILRFSLFQICTLLEASEFRSINSQKFRNMGIFKSLCIKQHTFGEKYGCPNIFDELAVELTRVYVLLLKEELTRGNIQWLLQFAYFELKSGFYKNSGVALAAFNTLFTDVLNDAEANTLRLVTDSASPKFLMMILDEVVHIKENPLVILQILLKKLVINRTVYKNFIKSNGLDLLFAILKNADFRFSEDIIYCLYTHSLGDYSVDLDGEISDILMDDKAHADSTVVMKELLILAVYLLEWTVINDISCCSPLNLDCFMSAFIKRMSRSLEKMTDEMVHYPFTMSLFQALTDLHVTLIRPQNSLIYENSSESLKKLVSDKILNAMMSFKPEDFSHYLEAMASSSDIKVKLSTIEEKKYGYFELSFFWLLVPGVFKGIREMGDLFSHELFNNNCMVSNFMLLFDRLKRYLMLFRFESIVYIDALECILLCLEGAKERSGVKRMYLSPLFEAFHLTVILMLRQNTEEESEPLNSELFSRFCSFLVDHSADILVRNSGLWNEESARFLLWVLLRQASHPNLLAPTLTCVETLLRSKAGIFDSVLRRENSNLPDVMKACSVDPKVVGQILHQEGAEEVQDFIDKSRDAVLHYAQSVTKIKVYTVVYPQELLKTEISVVKDAKMETRIEEMDRKLDLFQNDNAALKKKVRAAFRRIYSNFLTDKGEDEMLYDQQYFAFAMHLNHTLSLQGIQDCNEHSDWGLDSVQNSNGMKGHLVPVWRLFDSAKAKQETESSLKDGDSGDIPDQSEIRNTNNSFLSYDLMSDVETLKQPVTENGDENRKILKLLQGSDSIKKIWNTGLIIGLEVREGVLILGEIHLYFVSGYHFIKRDNKVVKLSEVPQADKDTNVNLTIGPPENQRSIQTNHVVHTWLVSDIIFIVKRPFLLRDTALEILFEYGTSFFFNFNCKSYKDDAYHTLDRLPKNKKIDSVLNSTLQELNNSSSSIGWKNGMYKSSLKTKLVKAFSTNLNLTDGFSATLKWQKGELSNFYYLMAVNALAGRTFNDITQYPVFPWVIADYTSQELDLENPATFRDLTKPMGAQSRRRRAQFIERYELLKAMKDPSSPPFHYGTHYSSAMIVSSYLIRLKPYVDSFLLLQDGRFGHADRLFNSIARAWSSAAVENTTDVRELIPEFFFLPEFLINLNKFGLGKDQQGNQVNDVILPPWAKGDPKIFIAKNREALESPYVSQNLHHWIDLIFGFKQRGEDAESAINVFNNLSYPGAVDLDSISDENERRAVTGIIHNFGQTPLQIFQSAHPARDITSIKQIGDSVWDKIPSMPRRTYQPDFEYSKSKKIKFIYWESYADGTVFWKGYPFLDVMIRSGSQLVPLKLCEPSSLNIDGKCYRMIHPCRVTSFFLWKPEEFLTGDENGFIQVWRYDNSKDPELVCLGKLYGHLSEIKDIRIYSDYSALLSVDINGNVYLWNLLDYQIIRKISSTGVQVAISQNYGNIAVYTMDMMLFIYDFGGMCYLSRFMGHKAAITCLEFINFTSVDLASKRHAYWEEKDVLVVGYENGELELYELLLREGWELKLLKRLNSGKNSEISSLRTQLRLHGAIDKSQNSVEKPKLEIMAGDSQGLLHLWN